MTKNPIIDPVLQLLNAAGIPPDQQRKVASILQGEGGNIDAEERFLKRREAASMLGVGPSRVDAYTYKGLLERAYVPGSHKALGIRLSSVRRLMASCTSAPTNTEAAQ